MVTAVAQLEKSERDSRVGHVADLQRPDDVHRLAERELAHDDLLRYLIRDDRGNGTVRRASQWNGVAESDRSTMEIGTRRQWPTRRERRSASPTG